MACNRHARPLRHALLSLALLSLACLAPLGASAQALRPPLDLRDSTARDIETIQGADVAGNLLRIDRLENQVRTLTGQLEQLQFQNKRLEDQMRKFQQDVEFRFQENSKSAAPAGRPPTAPAPGRRSDRTESPAAVSSAAVAGETAPLSPTPATRLNRRNPGDAFDPDASPGAPGAPRQLGSAMPATPEFPAGRAAAPLTAGPLGDLDDDPDSPVDLTRRPPRSGAATPAPQGATGEPPQQLAALPPPASSRETFDRASAVLKSGQFEAAEEGFRDFLRKYPKSNLVPDATFNLGESFYRRSRPREAAEQFLKVSTDYAQSRRAPEALVRLGLSLEKLGAKEQACAAYGEVARKYPNAGASTRTSAEHESKRAQC